MVTALALLNYIPIILLGLAIIYGGHYFLFRSILFFFNLQASYFTWVALLISGILTFSFIFASILAHWFKDNLTRAFYLLTSVWLGFALHLFLAINLVWLAKVLGNGLGLVFFLPYVTLFFLLLSAVFSFYGLYNGLHPIVKKIEARVKGLPEFWKNKTVVQLSDIHLGLINRRAFLSRIVNAVEALKPEAVFITGDLFDGMDGNLEEFVSPLKELRANSGIYFVTGNHEIYLGLERALAVVKRAGIKILDNEAVNLAGLQVIGLSYKVKENNLEAEIINASGWQAGLPAILLKHIPSQVEKAKKAGINIMLSGHTHVGQMWPFNLVSRLVYGRYHNGLHQEGDFYQYTSTGAGTWGPPMRTGNKPEIVAITLT